MKAKNNSQEPNQTNNSNNSNGYVKRYFDTLKSLIKDEANKPADERSRDIKALILTIIIVSILLLIAWNVPFIHNLIFP